MKKINSIFLVFIVSSLTIFNLNYALNGSSFSASGLSLKELILENTAHAYELPEVTITCDSGFGKCWDEDCHMEWTPLGGSRVTFCPAFTGSQSDLCVPGMPC